MNTRSIIRKIVIILFWIGIWAAAAEVMQKSLLLPSPVSVFVRIFELLLIRDFWKITLLSLVRISLGILAAIILGIVLASVTHYSNLLKELLSPVLTVVKVTPVASFIILALIWIGRDNVPIVISGLMVLPVVWNNVSAGLRNIDSTLMEMAEIYCIPRHIRYKRIVLPSVMPYFLSAIQTSIGIGWKAGIAAEVLTVPVLSIGKMIYESKMYMETTDLFAWTLVVICISLLIETILMKFVKKLGQKYNSEVSAHD